MGELFNSFYPQGSQGSNISQPSSRGGGGLFNQFYPQQQPQQVSQPQPAQPQGNIISRARQTANNFIDKAFKISKPITEKAGKGIGKVLDIKVPKKIALTYAKLNPSQQGKEFKRKVESGEAKTISQVFGIPRNITKQQLGTNIEETLNALFFALPATSTLRGATKTFKDFVKGALVGGTALTGVQAGITKFKGEELRPLDLAQSFGIGAAFGLAAPKQFPKAKNGGFVLSPKEARKQVVNSDLINTPVGKEIIKVSIEAEAKKTKVRITPNKASDLKTPNGTSVNVGLTIKSEGKYTRVISDRELKTFEETGKLPANKEGYVNVIKPGEKPLKVGENKKHIVTFKPEVESLIESEAKGQVAIKGTVSKTYIESVEKNIVKPKEVKPKIEAKPKPVEVKPQEVKVPREQLPVGEGKEKVSRLEARMKGVIGKATPEQIEQLGLSTFKVGTESERLAKAAKFSIENPKDAIRVLNGEIPPPAGIHSNDILVAMTQNPELIPELAIKLASLKSTAMGQNIGILKNIDPNNPVAIANEIYKIKEKVFQQGYGGKTPNEVIKKFVEKGKTKMQPPKFSDWGTVIKSVRC